MIGPILAIARKDLTLLFRDGANAFFTFVFPLLIAVFFGSVFGGGGESSRMNIAVVNEGSGEGSRGLVSDLVADDALAVTTETRDATDGPARPLTRSEGESLVRQGKVTACVIVPKEFDAGITGLFSGGGMKVEAVVDPARKAEAGLLTGKLNEHAFRQLSRSFSDAEQLTEMLGKARVASMASIELSPAQKETLSRMFDSVDAVTKDVGPPPLGDANSRTSESKPGDGTSSGEKEGGAGGWRPLNVEVRELASKTNEPRNGYEISFAQGVVWGLVGCVMSFGVSIPEERGRGTLMRLLTAPVSLAQVLSGKALGCFVSCVAIQLALVLFGELAFRVFGTAMFRVRVPSVAMLALAITASSIGFTGLMMLLAGLARTEAAAGGMARAIVLVLALIGGGSIPLFLLPQWARTASGVSPFRWANLAMEGATWRGFSPHEMMLPVGVLLAFGVGGFVIGVTALSRASRA